MTYLDGRNQVFGVISASGMTGVSWPENVYSEAFSAPGMVREHWQALVSAFEKMGPDILTQRQERARRMRHEDGATFNPFDNPSGRAVPWGLETIPLPITAVDWSILEQGLMQRALLLEAILADIYVGQNLVRNGKIPVELVFDNSRFLRPCHGIESSGTRYLPFYAVDIYRDPQGKFRVWRDYGANPAGIGYALENRIIISRLFHDLYHATQIRRLAPFFHTFRQRLIDQAARRREEPNIVLLSPGSQSHIYFEQALLSRYLNFQLVESQDLTVRNGKVFLKKLAGLEPVESIFRHIDDGESDPFALRRAPTNGVAGLIQVMREGNVDLTNPIGSGFIETPALKVFLPDLCRGLRGEELLLENHPSRWCGIDEVRDQVLAESSRFTFRGAIDCDLRLEGEHAQAAMSSAPALWLAEDEVRPSVVPFWEEGSLVWRSALLRIFLCATDGGFTVMPGGLAITANDIASLLGNVPERQRSKDIWVLSDQPVEPFSLMQGLQHIGEFRRGSDLPSRVADNLLWLGRYMERAEGLIRMLRSIFRRLAGEARARDVPELPFLFRLLEKHNPACSAFNTSEALVSYRQMQEILARALYDAADPESVLAIIRRVQETARDVRDRLSLDSWRVIDRLDSFNDNQGIEPLGHLDETLFTLSSFSGLAMESMTRGLGWRFLDMGRRLERAMFQVGLIHTGMTRVSADAPFALEALLEVSDSIMTYRARYRTAFQLAPVLDLLLMDETNPKSLAFQFHRLAAHVDQLPRQTERRFATVEERLALEMLTSVRLLDLTRLGREENSDNLAALFALLQKMEQSLLDFGHQITAHYLSRVPSTPHFSAIIPDCLP